MWHNSDEMNGLLILISNFVKYSYLSVQIFSGDIRWSFVKHCVKQCLCLFKIIYEKHIICLRIGLYFLIYLNISTSSNVCVHLANNFQNMQLLKKKRSYLNYKNQFCLKFVAKLFANYKFFIPKKCFTVPFRYFCTKQYPHCRCGWYNIQCKHFDDSMISLFCIVFWILLYCIQNEIDN